MDAEDVKWIYEGAMVKADKANKRMWILCIILIVIALLSNGAWLYYESQYQVTEAETTVTQDVSSDGDGDITVSGGDMTNGK